MWGLGLKSGHLNREERGAKAMAMATAARSAFLPLETCLHGSYEPDVEYVDGKLVERNVGEFDHNMIQRAILFWFYLHEKERGIRANRNNGPA
jgi:hypothetical protein